jgi:hypothetical protein
MLQDDRRMDTYTGGQVYEETEGKPKTVTGLKA